MLEQGRDVDEVQVKLKFDSAEQKMKKPLMRKKMKKIGICESQ